MSFLYPSFIYFLLPILFIIFGILFIKKESHQHYFSKEIIEKLKVNGHSLSLRTRNILFLISAILIVFSLAQPVIKDGSVEVKAKSSDIVIALDISDSMLAQDVYPNRLELAKQKALKFLKEIPDERVGIVAFAKNSYLVSPLSFDTSAVAFLLSQLDTSSITQKGTNLLSMLEVVANLKTSTDKKYLLILSDGGDKDDFTKEIEFAKDNGIVIFILGMGTIKGAPVKLGEGGFIKQNGEILISKLNENISELSTSSGGVYIQNTTSQNDIMTMISEISKISDKKELKTQEIQKYIPLFYYPLSLALLLVLIAISSLARKVSSPLLVLFIVLIINPDAKAGVLDFVELKEAKKAYEAGDYEKSAKYYERYANENDNQQSFYNAANSYYKQQNYEKALEYYKKVKFKDDKQKANNLANMGNAYVKIAKEDSLINAKKSYEKSLELVEDKKIRENLEAVLKELEKQEKQESKDKKNNKDKENKDDDSQDKDKNKKDSKSEKDKQDKNKDKEKKDKADKEKRDKEEKDKADKEKRDKEKRDKANKKKKEKEKKDKKPEKNKQEDEDISKLKPQMSDEEEQKWLNKLNLNQKTYLYRLDNQKQNEVNIDEKPW